MTTARELMTDHADCVRTSDTLVTAAQRMKELDVGAMPICGDDDRLAGMITDRDIVVKCIAEGGDPLVGMLSQADIARNDPDLAGRIVSELSSSPSNN